MVGPGRKKLNGKTGEPAFNFGSRGPSSAGTIACDAVGAAARAAALSFAAGSGSTATACAGSVRCDAGARDGDAGSTPGTGVGDASCEIRGAGEVTAGAATAGAGAATAGAGEVTAGAATAGAGATTAGAGEVTAGAATAGVGVAVGRVGLTDVVARVGSEAPGRDTTREGSPVKPGAGAGARTGSLGFATRGGKASAGLRATGVAVREGGAANMPARGVGFGTSAVGPGSTLAGSVVSSTRTGSVFTASRFASVFTGVGVTSTGFVGAGITSTGAVDFWGCGFASCFAGAGVAAGGVSAEVGRPTADVRADTGGMVFGRKVSWSVLSGRGGSGGRGDGPPRAGAGGGPTRVISAGPRVPISPLIGARLFAASALTLVGTCATWVISSSRGVMRAGAGAARPGG